MYWRIRSQTPVGSCTGADGTMHYGITVGNVPIGTPGFIQVKLRAKADEVVRYVAKTVQHLNAAEPQALWAAIHYCCQSRFDFWLRHCDPSQTQEVVEIVDAAVMQAAALAMRQDLGELRADHFIWRRLRLPSRMRGCGLRDRRLVAHIAFVSCFVEVAEQLVTPTGGFFPMLTRISPHDFDPANPQAPRLDTFLQPNPNTGSPDSPTAAAFLESWEHLQGFLMLLLTSPSLLL